MFSFHRDTLAEIDFAGQVEDAIPHLRRWRRSEYYTDDYPVFLKRNYADAVIRAAAEKLDAERNQGQ